MKKETHRVLRSLEKMGEKEFVPSIGPIKGEIIRRIINQHRPKNILEIGTLYGYSAILMADMIPADGKLVTIDIDKSIADIAGKNITDAGLSDKIDIIVGNALKVIPTLVNWKFDLIFIDAAKDQYLNYLKLAEINAQKGTVIVADNVEVSKHEMLDYLEYVRNSGIYKSETIETTLEFTPNLNLLL
jgi:predicted O-methyltransferase YrrM